MTEQRDDVLSRLRGGVWSVLDEDSERARRERIGARVLEVQRQLRAQQQRRRRYGLVAGLAALVAGAAASVAVIIVPGSGDEPVAVVPTADVVRLVAGHASLRDGTTLEPLAPGARPLGAEPVLVTAAGDEAELRLASDTELRVAPATEVRITRRRSTPDSFEERVRLRAGSVALRVPKLGARGKVSVETRDALVEVHGTQFSVRVVDQPPLAAFTEVAVREGRVLVRSGSQSRFVGAGESWSSRVEAPVVAAPAAAPPAVAPPARPVKKRAAALERRPVPASELAAQNRLLEAAELAQKGGMLPLALDRLDTLIARYPDAELADNARVQRFRVLHLAGRDGEALAAARDYLERRPEGFASAEAKQLIEALSGRR
jgi:hypothetical protein